MPQPCTPPVAQPDNLPPHAQTIPTTSPVASPLLLPEDMTTKTLLFGAALATMFATAACGTDTDVASECEPFLDTTEEATPVTVAIENDSPDPIFLVSTGCSSEVELLLRDGDGAYVDRGIGSCGPQTCEQLMEEPRYDCAALCAQPPTVMVAPGGRYETTWDGFVFTQTEMPSGCFADATTQGQASCSQKLVAGEGVYTAGFNVATAITCNGGAPDQDCTCTPDEDGVCVIDFGYADSMTEVTGQAQYPSETQIDIVFGDGLGS